MTMENDLVERLRKRAESERDIQRNNEAVVTALQPQMDAFDKRDGSHNTFAVRLYLDHKGCAKTDAELAADWDAAASRIQALEAELARKTEALDRVAEWARAYPLSVFPEPDFAKVRELLWAGGIMIDAVSASNMRHVITQVDSIARSALEEKTDV